MQKHQSAEHLPGELADKFQREALEIVSLNKFVQVHAKEFRRNAKVTTEIEALGEVYDTMFFVRVLEMHR